MSTATTQPRIRGAHRALKRRTSIYYGVSRWGKRVHLGNEESHVEGHGLRVLTFCGGMMWTSTVGWMPSPKSADEFCKNCFRTLAWEAFQYRMSELARNGGH